MVDLFFVKTFVSVAKTGSFRIAAERNFISQPAVSGHIKILERELNCTLFERQGKRTFLTSSGKTFLVYAEHLLKLFEEAKIQVDMSNNRTSGMIKIATIYSIGLHELKSFLQIFLKKYPQINVHLEYQQSHKIYELVLNREVDFGLVAYPKKVTGITNKIFANDDLVLVQSCQNRIFKKKTIQLKDLNHVKYVSLAISTPTGQAINNFLHTHKIYPDIVNEYDNIETLKCVTEIGIGYTIVPKTTVLNEIKKKSLEIISVSNLNLQRPLGLIYTKGKFFTRSSEIFHNMLFKKEKER